MNWFSVVLYRLKHFWNVIPILLLVDRPTVFGQTFATDDLQFELPIVEYFRWVQSVQGFPHPK